MGTSVADKYIICYPIKNWPALLVAQASYGLIKKKLAFLDSLSGALIGAGTAGNADISVDNVLAFALGNSLNGALVGAGAASNTSVSDNVCHDIYLHDFLYVFHVMFNVSPL